MLNQNFLQITFGGGCFWCLESVFLHLNGIEKVVSGYSGGDTQNPSYQEICTGKTNHAEVIQITFDEKKISLERVLEIFWHLHDPTTPNKQGNDVGTQYRSIIFYTNTEQKKIAEKIKQNLENSKVYENPIVTEIKALEKFYPAEDYHQNYFQKNPNSGYCQITISPKIAKLRLKYLENLIV